MLYIFGDYTLNQDLYELHYKDAHIHIEPHVFEVLSYLVQHCDRVVSKHELFEHLWPQRYVSDKALVRCMQKARHAINDQHGKPRLIQTIYGRGYRFAGVVRQDAQRPPVDERPLGPHALATSTQPPGHQTTSRVTSPQATWPSLSGVPDGERKQVTVVVGVLDNAAELAAQLGDETMHRVMQEFLGLAQRAVQQYEGTLTECRVNGFMALFGAPLTHEDHARRAVRTALNLVQCLQVYPTFLGLPLHTRPDVRLGLHTGWVVVGSLGEEQQTPYVAMSSVTQLAEHLQQCAAPDVILVSEATARLVQSEVHLEPWEQAHEVPQADMVRAYRVLAARPRPLSWIEAGSYTQRRFVGRTRELALLHERLQQVEGSEGQAVSVLGEAGLGKSRLLYEFLQRLEHKHVTCLVGRCLSYGRTTPYLPVLDLIRQYCEISEADPPETITSKLRLCLQAVRIDPDTWAPYLLHVLGVNTGTECLAELSPAMLKSRTYEALWQIFLASSRRQPLILAIEDLHWIDATSEECLASLVERLAGAPIFCLFTYRPGYAPSWLRYSFTTQLALSRLTLRDSVRVLQGVSGTQQLPDAVAQMILAKANGNPFFVEELSRAVLEQGQQQASCVLPDTIQAVLATRIDRLPPGEKRLLQAAAVIGKEVSYALLQAISGWPAETLDQSLHGLRTTEFLYETHLLPEHVYTFKHALTQEVAYQSLLQGTRRHYHEQVAQMLVERFPETVETQPELVAYHYTEAGRGAQAVPYWHQAGQRAIARSASAEAISHLTHGIETLQTLPVTPERTQQELLLQITLGAPRRMLKGNMAPEVEGVYTRALELSQQVADSPQRFATLIGLWGFVIERARFRMVRELAEQSLALAQRLQDPEILQEAHAILGVTLYFDGAFAAAQVHFEHSMALHDPQKRRPSAFRRMAYPEVMSLAYMSWILWMLGSPDQALVQMQRAHTLAQEYAHAYSIGYVSHEACTFHQYRHEVQLVHTYAEAAIAFARERGFVRWLAGGLMRRGWALAQQGTVREGLGQLREGLAMWQTQGGELGLPYHLSRLAEVYGQAGQPEAGFQVLAEAQATARQHTRRSGAAELLRLRGELLLQRDMPCLACKDSALRSVSLPPSVAEAEVCFHQAIAIARGQQAKSLELRATVSLSRLWHSEGKDTTARQVLGACYRQFTEGFDTRDLREAKALLDTLA